VFRRGNLLSFLFTATSAFGYDLNVTVSSQQIHVGEPVRLTYTFARKPNDDAVDYRFAGPGLAHFQLLSERSETFSLDGNEVWQKHYVVLPLQTGEVATGEAAMNVAKRAYEKDAWGQWMPTIKWEQHRYGSVSLYADLVPQGVGTVGRFTLTATTDKNETESGRPVRLTLSLKGCGNLKTAEPIKLKIAGVSAFDEGKTQRAVWKGGCYYSESNQTFALVGSRDFTIPSIVYRTYDPQQNMVVTAETLPIVIHVDGAVNKNVTEREEDEMTVWSLMAGVVLGIVIGAAATLLWQRRRTGEKRVRYDSMRTALIELFKHLEDPEAKKSAEAVEKYLYEGAAEPDRTLISDVIERLKRGAEK